LRTEDDEVYHRDVRVTSAVILAMILIVGISLFVPSAIANLQTYSVTLPLCGVTQRNGTVYINSSVDNMSRSNAHPVEVAKANATGHWISHHTFTSGEAFYVSSFPMGNTAMSEAMPTFIERPPPSCLGIAAVGAIS
jgi:hypothetical protein